MSRATLSRRPGNSEDQRLIQQPGSPVSVPGFLVSEVIRFFPGFRVSCFIFVFTFTHFSHAALPPSALSTGDRALLAEVQRAGIRYFYEFGHPVSGLTRVGSERPPELCEIGGTGWGCFNLIVAAERGFVPREKIADRVRTMLRFLAKADRFHGAFPHWMNGDTGKTIPFNKEDDGADLVETAFLAQGMIALREYFTRDDAVEKEIRALADRLWREIEWDFFAQEKDGRAVLLWHWSPQFGWKKGMAIQGFNETHIIYLLALCSPTHPVPAKFYREGWEGGGERFRTKREDFGIPMTLGRGMNMPLFFAQNT
jgi:hypothetical protein